MRKPPAISHVRALNFLSLAANTELYIAEFRAQTRDFQKHPYSGYVYKVTDGPAANDLTVELLGKLTLSDLTDNAGWSKLSSVNFL